MACGRRKPKYKTKASAKRHGAISYGRRFAVRKVRGGWKAYRR